MRDGRAESLNMVPVFTPQIFRRRRHLFQLVLLGSSLTSYVTDVQ